MEVMVAVTLLAIVLVGASSLVTALSSSASQLTAAARAQDRRANGERLLRSLLGAAFTDDTSATWFAGDRDAMHFSTWCRAAGGWTERCRVDVGVRPSQHGHTILLTMTTAVDRQSLTLQHDTAVMHLRYLESAVAGGQWRESWDRGVTLPLAIGLLVGRDTVLIPIWARG
jgi:hypothetical protein